MNLTRFDRAVEEAQRVLAQLGTVRTLILYGSTARGTATEESDIDLFIECAEKNEESVSRTLYGLDKRFDVRFSPMFYQHEDWRRFDLQFLESIFRNGRLLFGRMPALNPIDLDLQPLRLVRYHTERLSPRKRAQMLRAIDGYRTTKRVGKKRYVVEKPGFLKEAGGWRVGRGSVIVPEEKIEAFDHLLLHYRAKRHIIAIWCQRP